MSSLQSVEMLLMDSALKADFNVQWPANFVASTSKLLLLYEDPTASGVLTSVKTETWVQNGEITDGITSAIANASALYLQDPNSSNLFSFSGVLGQKGPYSAIATSNAQVIGTFALQDNESFSFNFNAIEEQSSKEIESFDREYAYAAQNTSFVVLDITYPEQIEVIDFFNMIGRLDSSDRLSIQWLNHSENIKATVDQKNKNIDGNDGYDSHSRVVLGHYSRIFNQATQIAVVEVIHSYTKVTDGLSTSTSEENLVEPAPGPTDIVGSSASDNLFAYSGVLFGLAGDDKIYSVGGSTLQFGGTGNDRLHGASQVDFLEGEKGNDVIFGNGGNDTIRGGDGNDSLYGSFGDEILLGGNGDDIIFGNGGNDTFRGGAGNDDLYGGNGNDVFEGGEGRDRLFSNGGNDFFVGGAGDDVFYTGNDADMIDGGLGDDEIYLVGGQDIVILRVGDGVDIINGFQLGQTTFGLSDGLQFSDLNFRQSNGFASIFAGHKELAKVSWVDSGALDHASYFSVI